jgi:hypothetical protein
MLIQYVYSSLPVIITACFHLLEVSQPEFDIDVTSLSLNILEVSNIPLVKARNQSDDEVSLGMLLFQLLNTLNVP